MTADDLSQALALSTAEGWNQTEKDWRLLLENPANICIVAEKDNKVAGTATALVHSGKIAWIGMVIVDNSLRGQGAGKMLMTQIIGKLKHVESIKLDATPAGQPLYKSLGFIYEYTIFRMTNQSLDLKGSLPAENPPGKDDTARIDGKITEKISVSTAEEVFVSDEKSSGKIAEEIFAFNEKNSGKIIEEIFEFDEKIFGADRRYLLAKLIEDFPGKAFIIKTGSKTNGYILGRDGSRFNYIGPLCADSFETTRTLISESLRSLVGKPVALDVPERQVEFINWLESAGFVKQRHFIRMYLNKNTYPGLPGSQYLISGPEYG
jgi:GNAT superfamily N-acetyltransferase